MQHALEFPQFRHGYYGTVVREAAAALPPAFVPRLYPVPRQGGTLSAGVPFQEKVRVPHGSYLIGFTGSSNQAAGFQLQLRAVASGEELCSEQIKHANLTGGTGASRGAYNILHVLPRPWIIVQPAELIVELFNLATSAATLQLVLWVAQPREAP